MLEKSVMYILLKGAAITVSILFLGKAGAGMDFLLILALAFSCILAFDCLLGRIVPRYYGKLQWIFNMAMLAMVFLYGGNSFFPLLLVILVQMIDNYTAGSYFYSITAGAAAFAALVMNPSYGLLISSFLLIALLFYIRRIREREEAARALVLEQKEELAKLKQKLSDNRQLTKTLQYTAALEERNRLAARLHDKVGHGISGSIILLEASRLILDQDPQRAKEGIDRAVNNLRDGVDDIRKALREERPVRSELGQNEIHAVLESFQADHGVRTLLRQSGNIDYITAEIWQCIHENLEEALTNLLKHSDATEFRFSIQVMNKIIKAEYLDNGTQQGKFTKGLGLEAVEERTIKCGGRCFFESTEAGFRITNIFT